MTWKIVEECKSLKHSTQKYSNHLVTAHYRQLGRSPLGTVVADEVDLPGGVPKRLSATDVPELLELQVLMMATTATMAAPRCMRSFLGPAKRTKVR